MLLKILSSKLLLFSLSHFLVILTAGICMLRNGAAEIVHAW